MEGQYMVESTQLCSNWSTLKGCEGNREDLGVINMRLGNLRDGIFQINLRGLFRYGIYLIMALYGVFDFGYAKDLVSLEVRLWNRNMNYFVSIFLDISLVVMLHRESNGFGIKVKKELVIKPTNFHDLIDDNYLIWYQTLYWSIRNMSLVATVYIHIIEKRFFISQLTSIFSTLNDLIFFSVSVLIMSQGQLIVKSGGKKGEMARPGLRVTVPWFYNSELIASFSKTLIGRCMNPQKPDMKILLFLLPRIWNGEGRVVGTDLVIGRFQFAFKLEEYIVEVLKMEPFHFDYWMISLVRWKPVLEPNYPSKITFWVRVMDLPLLFRAAENFQSVGKAIGTVQGPVDLIEGRVRVEIDGFKPLVFSVTA